MQDIPRSFQKFKKMPFILSLLFMACACVLYFFLHKQINDNAKISEQAQIDWQAESTKRNEIRSLNNSVKAIETEKAQLESHFAQSSDIVPFLDTIENLALSVKVKTEVVSVDILEDRSGLLAEINAAGSFESIYKFLKLLENSPYELEFETVDAQRPGDPPEWKATIKMKLLTFLQ